MFYLLLICLQLSSRDYWLSPNLYYFKNECHKKDHPGSILFWILNDQNMILYDKIN